MPNFIKRRIAGAEIIFLPEKCLWYPAQAALCLADLHIGKSTHFQRFGQYLPQTVKPDLYRLERLLKERNIKTCFFLGDLFHSTLNDEWKMLDQFFSHHQQVTFHLILGNHDILPRYIYEQSLLKVSPDSFFLAPLRLIHQLPDLIGNEFVVAGHIHPAVQLYDHSGAQTQFPCFYLAQNYLILPAFGSATGTSILQVKKGDEVFVTNGEEIAEVSQSL